MNRQSTLFAEDDVPVLAELDLRQAQDIADRVEKAVCSRCSRIEVAGSIRREKATVHDIDFVTVTKNDVEWQKISQTLKRKNAQLICSGNSVIKALLRSEKGLFQVDFYRAQPNTWGIHLLVRTGSAAHNTWLASLAISKSMRIKYNEGLTKDDAMVAGETEQSVFKALGLQYQVPSQREIVGDKPMWLLSSQTK
jgi:DNA polymerase (family 10)